MPIEMTPITDRTAHERYERDGFVMHQQAVADDALLKRAARGLEAVKDGVSDTGEEPDHRYGKPGDDPRALVKIEHPQLASQALRQLLLSPELGEVAARAVGATRVQVWWVQGLYKPGLPESEARLSPSGGANVGWHQDRFYWQGWEEGSELFTAWLALSDVTGEAGPMVFVPGSHRWGLSEGSDFFGQDQDALREAIHVPEGEKWTEVADVLPMGGVSIHHQLLIHGSYANRSPLPRRSLAIHLCTQNSRALPNAWVSKYLHREDICPVIYQK